MGHCCLFGLKFMLQTGGYVVVVQYDLIIESGGLCSAHILKYHLPMRTKIHVLKRTILAKIIPAFASGPRSYGNSYSQKQKTTELNFIDFPNQTVVHYFQSGNHGMAF